MDGSIDRLRRHRSDRLKLELGLFFSEPKKYFVNPSDLDWLVYRSQLPCRGHRIIKQTIIFGSEYVIQLLDESVLIFETIRALIRS